MKNEKLLAKIEEKGLLFERLLTHSSIIEIRRVGLFFAIEMKDKETVLDFIEKLKKDLKAIDVRRFKRCMIFYLTGSPDWKKHVYSLLS